MQRTLILLAAFLGALCLLFAQRPKPPEQPASPAHLPYEMISVFPRETSPGQYEQVDQRELKSLASDGWELVGVTPFIYRNEEHNNGEMHGPRPVITQTYPAYFFKRLRAGRN